MKVLTTALGLTVAGTLIGVQIGRAAAAPLPTNIAIMKSLAVDGPTQVHWHGGWGWGAGALAGALIGGAIASGGYGYYAPPYDCGYPYRYYHPRSVYSGYGPHYDGYGAYPYYRSYPVRRHYYRHHYWRHHW